jgi:putative transposase
VDRGHRAHGRLYRTGQPLGERLLREFQLEVRDELLNGEIFYSLKEAGIVIQIWRRHHNEVRPHSSLDYRPPAPSVLFAERHAALSRSASPGSQRLIQRGRS